MKKYLIFAALVAFVIGSYASDKISRIATIPSDKGTTDYNGATLVTSQSPTNQFKMVQSNVTFSAGSTTKTYSFGTAFSATPTIIIGSTDGFSLGWPFNHASSISQTTIQMTTSSTTFTRAQANTGAATVIPSVWYGYTRTGVFQ